MKKTPKKTAAITEQTWKKLHDAYVAPTTPALDYEPLKVHARRLRVPLFEAECRAAQEEWNAERQAIEARVYFEETAPGIKTELAYCAHRATEMAAGMGGDLGAIGGEGLLGDLIADARVIWRKRMSRILIWDAMQASKRHGVRRASAAGRAA